MKFRKKPVIIEAMQWQPGRYPEWANLTSWLVVEHCDFVYPEPVEASTLITILTIEGAMTARPGDWIIRGVKGEFYPCKPDIFEATYEAVES